MTVASATSVVLTAAELDLVNDALREYRGRGGGVMYSLRRRVLEARAKLGRRIAKQVELIKMPPAGVLVEITIGNSKLVGRADHPLSREQIICCPIDTEPVEAGTVMFTLERGGAITLGWDGRRGLHADKIEVL